MVDYGRNTKGYQAYCKAVPKVQRAFERKEYPSTPDIYRKCSKRAFDGLIREWRIALHKWDPPEGEDAETLTQADADVAADELSNLDAELAKEVEAEVAAEAQLKLGADGGDDDIDLNDDDLDVLVNLDDDDDDDGILVSLDD